MNSARCLLPFLAVAPVLAEPQKPGHSPEVVRQIHALIGKTSTDKEGAQMKPYTGKVPRAANAPFQMVPIPGGEFMMGSPAEEKHHKPDEGPPVKVKIEPFWMGAHEVTWDTAMAFILEITDRDHRAHSTSPHTTADALIDSISGPSEVFYDLARGMGIEGHPAAGVTEHFALTYCLWLSAQTGHFYRLPTEAEWEYAARAGTRTAWSFGDDAAALGDFAWFFDNSEGTTHPVGLKKPNPWGLHDMYGNVCELTLDEYNPRWHAELAARQEAATGPLHVPTRRYPRSIRGGSFDSDAKDCRSAARQASRYQWKKADIRTPKSAWLFASAPFTGFRIVRPVKVPPAEEMHRIWNLGTVGEDK